MVQPCLGDTCRESQTSHQGVIKGTLSLYFGLSPKRAGGLGSGRSLFLIHSTILESPLSSILHKTVAASSLPAPPLLSKLPQTRRPNHLSASLLLDFNMLIQTSFSFMILLTPGRAGKLTGPSENVGGGGEGGRRGGSHICADLSLLLVTGHDAGANVYGMCPRHCANLTTTPKGRRDGPHCTVRGLRPWEITLPRTSQPVGEEGRVSS